ncbi:MAG TPA: chalcone isomerase family protein [Burkholderiaceae bacterium]|nr:chalcone isomerase family protein [Burkholderiaceae bacterium]
MRKLLVTAALLIATSAAWAQASWVSSSIPEARKAGSGMLRYFGLHIYDAELWTLPGFNAAQFTEQPLALRLTYARRLVGKLIAERSEKEMAELGLGTAEDRARWLAQMTKLFPDVSKGDSLSVLVLPGQGARFFRNDQPLGDVQDPAFARAFISIWLHPKTSQPGLRAQLIGAK